MRWRSQPEGRVFISYRRSDARGVAGRLSDTLSDYFGSDRVFRDIEDIAGGADYGEVIEGSLSSADAVIVLIGPEWVTVAHDDGRRRLDDPDDWVAAEIGSALERGVPVFPVLIDETRMPHEEDLPDRLKPLSARNAVSISDARWKDDTTRLAKIIALDLPGSVGERSLNQTRVLIMLLMLGAVAFTTAWFTLESRSLIPEQQTSEILLAAWASGVNFVAIMASAILLLIRAPLIDSDRRLWAYVAASVGTFGSLAGLLVYFLLPERTETIGLFFLSTVIIVAMLSLMNLSGFKPK